MSIIFFKDIVKLHDLKINIEIMKELGSGVVIFEETKPEAKLKKVTIKGLDIENTFAFNIDHPNDKNYILSPFLNNSTPNITKVCDGIIFSVVEGQLIVYLCELKSEKPKQKDYINKFRNSAVFIFYLENLAKEFFDFKENLIIKRILFDMDGSSKTNTSGNKIKPREMLDDKHKPIEIYNIHNLKEDKYLNIRHLA